MFSYKIKADARFNEFTVEIIPLKLKYRGTRE